MKKIYALMLGMTMACGLAWADTEHKVQAGETLQSIASRYNVSVEAIKAVNPKASKYVYAGMVLTIPSTTAAPAKSVISADTPAAAAPAKTVITADTPAAPAPAKTVITADTPAAPAPAKTVITADTPAAPAPTQLQNVAATNRPAGNAQPLPADVSKRSKCKSGNIILEHGDASILHQSVVATLVSDFSNAKTDGGQTLRQYQEAKGPDWVRDWPGELSKAEIYFTERFNKKNKKGLTVSSTDNAPYTLLITIDNVDFGDSGSSFIPFAGPKAGGCILTGTISVVEKASGNVLCQYYMNEVKGVSHYTMGIRLGLAYLEMGTLLYKINK